MQRIVKDIPISNIKLLKEKALNWAQQFKTVCWLDSNQYPSRFSSYEAILALGAFTSIKTDYTNAFCKLQEYQLSTQDYLFGYLGYDLKNDVEDLYSNNFDGLNFPDIFFFQPKKLIFFLNNSIQFLYLDLVANDIESDFKAIQRTFCKGLINKALSSKKTILKPRINKQQYLKKADKLLNHIQRGDIYEVNFCQEFYAENCTINPLQIYQNLNAISEPPFASYLKFESGYLLSASLERYLKKDGKTLVAQPIKGTAKRFGNKNDDILQANRLANNPKEQSENIMIVDLVRNDLSKTAQKGSVVVQELCRVYSFKQVHQLISTITSLVKEDASIIDVIKDTFPMGSMTGAPKIAAMKLIEEIEETKRGLYSGAVGYFTPKHNFDFNVVIRSILYNQSRGYVSFSVGSAITAKSIPEKEYEECLLKAKAMKDVLTGKE